MTERGSTAKQKKGEKAKPAETVAADSSALASENARLKSELAEALKRIAELEQKHNDVINRIDWVIDSLHSLTE